MVRVRRPLTPFGHLRVCLLLGATLVQVSCDTVETTSLSVSPTPPAHRGAARQMYGSGSLRPSGAKPIFATGERQHGTRTTLSPQSQRRQYPIYDPQPLDDFSDIHGGYPPYPEVQRIDAIPPRSARPSYGANGMYGGRPEYYQGRPYYSFSNGKHPFDFGFMPGRGFIPDSVHKAGDYDYEELDGNSAKQPGEDEKNLVLDRADGNWHCEKVCQYGDVLCYRGCTCIKENQKCDGESDCEANEDEIDCDHHDHYAIKCDETKNYILCPNTNRCILKGWLCDGDDDCGDYSDETHCGLVMNCTNDQFQCENGLCIPKLWTCDNDNDCKDFSDEVNCTIMGCKDNEFECSDSTCISLGWKCDRHADCSDGSDEHDCTFSPPYCADDDFQCATHKCIKLKFKCDGDNDCDDWSDEEDCSRIPDICVKGEFKCNDGRCISERYKCDRQRDCIDNEDEQHCDYNITKTCSPDEYTCDSGGCILKTWVCDGFDDCFHGDDESKCEIICDESKFPCSGIAPNDTKTEFCINKKHRCDGQRDCPKGEDEENCSSKRECEKNTKCKQLCVTTAEGKDGCSCFNGFKLAEDGYNCEDINECLYATDPVCSQTCNNTFGSFKCGCMTGYVLRPDLRTCKAMGAPPTLLFANRVDIRQVSLSNTKYTAILKGLHNAIALDYHYDKAYIYWTDVSMDVIRRAFINGTGVTDVIKSGLESPGGVALDWIHDLIFWTDSGTRRIEVATLDGQERAIIAASEVDKPRAIAVHPGECLIFWTDWGPSPKIERAEMDGTNRKSIITESVFWPNGLTIDYTSNQLYWADAKHNVIETALFDGSNRKKVISKGLPHPFAITIFEDAIFWTDWHTKSITTASKTTGAGLRTVHSHLHFPMDIHSYHPQRQPTYPNKCGRNNGGCAHMCLPTKSSFKCICRMGQKLKSDKKNCQKPDKFLLFARRKDIRLRHLDGNSQHQYEMVIPVDGVKHAIAIAWDSKTDLIYWTDIERNTLNRAFWNGSSQEVLIRTNLITPAGVTLDWATDKIYWTDANTSRIEVANTDGTMRSLLVWEELDTPRDIVVDPQSGYMFWTQWGEIPRVERAHMDGTTRMVIITANLTWPSGLAVDHVAGKIYWTDAGSQTIEFSDMDGLNRKTLLGGSSVPRPFGLDVFGNHIFWTDWETNSIERADKTTGLNRTVLSTKMIDLMNVRVFHRTRKSIKHSCSVKNGGCSHLCLLRPKGHSCGCPTGIKLGGDEVTCAYGPVNFLILAHRVEIRQISLDVPYRADVVLPFPRLKLATSVDVDRKTGEIYWTDTEEDTIRKASPDGKKFEVVVMHEMEAPDGIAIDSTGRKMYWTDGDRNSIEVAELDGSNRKLLFHRNLENPRAITLHYHHGLMFWSEWGTLAKIESAHMDGTNRKTLISKNLIWPNGLAIDRPENRLYWNDAKMNTIESSDLKGKDRKLITNSVKHPYGLVVVGNHIYWTDWFTRSLHRADKNTGSDLTTIVDNLEGLMDVRSVQSDNIAENACGKNNGGCSHLCLRNPTSFSCACPTGLSPNKDDPKQCELIPQTFLLVATTYALSQISLDTDDAWDVALQINEIHNAIDVDFHWEKKLIFYTDIERNVIQSVSMYNLSDVKTIVEKNLSTCEGIAVDWISNIIYWTNTGNKVIEASKLDGSYRTTIVKDHLHDPKSIAVFPKLGLLFWTDWVVPKIERSFLDGSDRKKIVHGELNFPIGLAIDDMNSRLYWIDAKSNAEKIETTDLMGTNRVILNIETTTHPYSLTIYQEFLFWTDWSQKTILRAEKTSGQDTITIRTKLDAAMGITMVTAERQRGWNPCAIENGHCTHLCFFRYNNYVCRCPDAHTPDCKTEPIEPVPLKCPTDGRFKCDDEVWIIDKPTPFGYPPMEDTTSETTSVNHPPTFHYIIIPFSILFCFLLVILIAGVIVLIKRGKKKFLYGVDRGFTNPNYFSSNGGTSVLPNNGKTISKRLKYNKSQERVYEETVCVSSPEIASLIPTILTPCSSNCETVTPEIEISPSITPRHQNDIVETVS